MARRGERDLAKERFWRRQLQRWQRSQLSSRDFCSQYHLSEPSFYAWRRTLAQRDQLANRTAATTSARRLPSARPAPLPTLVPVQVISAPTPALERVLGKGRLLRVPPGFDAATLRQLLALVEEPSC